MKYRVLIFLGLMAFLSLASSPIFAHHSMTAVYDISKTTKIEGTLKEFLWRNPHSFIKVEAPDDKGQMQLWVIEGAAPTQLSESGLSKSTLRPGDHYRQAGARGRRSQNAVVGDRASFGRLEVDGAEHRRPGSVVVNFSSERRK